MAEMCNEITCDLLHFALKKGLADANIEWVCAPVPNSLIKIIGEKLSGACLQRAYNASDLKEAVGTFDFAPISWRENLENILDAFTAELSKSNLKEIVVSIFAQLLVKRALEEGHRSIADSIVHECIVHINMYCLPCATGWENLFL